MPMNRRNINEDKNIEIRIKHPVTNETIRIYEFNEQIDIKDINMIKAKVEYKNGDVFRICFRNPKNLSIKEMRRGNLFDGLARHGDLNNLKYGKYNYLGTILYDREKKKNPYSIILPKEEEKNYVRKNMDTQLEVWEERQKEESKHMEEEEPQKEQRKEFKESIQVSEEINQRLKDYFNKKNENKQNPFLKIGKLENENGEEEKIYEGVDLTTGDFLILKDLQCELIDEKYIYSGYLNYIDTLEEKNTMTKKELESYEVIFESPYEIDKAIEEGNINSILQILSKNESLLKRYRLNMLGKIEESGRVSRPPYKASEKIFSYYKQKARDIYEKYKEQKGKEIE